MWLELKQKKIYTNVQIFFFSGNIAKKFFIKIKNMKLCFAILSR